jgi:thiamine biosynthesis lipoprotein
MKRNIYSIFTLFLVALVLLTGCTDKQLHTESNFYLYTQVQLTTYGKLDQAVYDEIWSTLNTIDQTLSMKIASSEVNQINKNAGKKAITVSEETFQLIKTAKDYSEIDDNFDISVGPLVSLWGIGTEEAKLPRQTEIDQVLPLINYREIELDPLENSVYLKREGMQIDLGAIAKGYAADLTKLILKKHNIHKAIINYGGNILAVGDKLDDTPWKIGLQHPDKTRGTYLGIVPLSSASIVTSGVYERFLTVDGINYHHILSPKDGYPVTNGLLSVSIISKDSIDGDAFSTLIFARGLEDGLDLIESLPDVEALFITSESKIYLTSGLKDTFVLSDPTFEVVERNKK